MYSYLAQRDAKTSQKLAEASRLLAADSREIAAAAKRDSSALKAIAILTMLFLPGTFLAVSSIVTDRPIFAVCCTHINSLISLEVFLCNAYI